MCWPALSLGWRSNGSRVPSQRTLHRLPGRRALSLLLALLPVLRLLRALRCLIFWPSLEMQRGRQRWPRSAGGGASLLVLFIATLAALGGGR